MEKNRILLIDEIPPMENVFDYDNNQFNLFN